MCQLSAAYTCCVTFSWMLLVSFLVPGIALWLGYVYVDTGSGKVWRQPHPDSEQDTWSGEEGCQGRCCGFFPRNVWRQDSTQWCVQSVCWLVLLLAHLYGRYTRWLPTSIRHLRRVFYFFCYARYRENSTESKIQLPHNFSYMPRCHGTVSTVMFVNKHEACLLLLFLR